MLDELLGLQVLLRFLSVLQRPMSSSRACLSSSSAAAAATWAVAFIFGVATTTLIGLAGSAHAMIPIDYDFDDSALPPVSPPPVSPPPSPMPSPMPSASPPVYVRLRGIDDIEASEELQAFP